MKYYIIAGEASGDLHAANLVSELKKKDKNAQIRAWGGELLQKQGVNLAKHYKDTAFMGFVEVVKNLRTIKSLFKFCQQDILAYQPDLVILVDYPGFNLRIAEFTHQHHIKTYYYISPKIWAWKKKRAYKIKAFVDKMFVIFPFEIDFYKQYNYQVEYIGNPLLDEIEKQKPYLPNKEAFVKENQLSGKPIIALLAGSRQQEIERILPTMLKISPNFPEFQFVIAGAPGLEPELYRQYMENDSTKIVYNQTYSLLHHSTAAIVASGTATLETALFNVPQIVAYKMSALTFEIARRLVKIKHISLVNIILNKETVKELIQHQFSVEKAGEILRNLVSDTPQRKAILDDYQELKQKLGDKGASERAAEIIYKSLIITQSNS